MGKIKTLMAQCLQRFESFYPHKDIHKNASVAQSGLEHLRPKERVVGSNPIGRVTI